MVRKTVFKKFIFGRPTVWATPLLMSPILYYWEMSGFELRELRSKQARYQYPTPSLFVFPRYWEDKTLYLGSFFSCLQAAVYFVDVLVRRGDFCRSRKSNNNWNSDISMDSSERHGGNLIWVLKKTISEGRIFSLYWNCTLKVKFHSFEVYCLQPPNNRSLDFIVFNRLLEALMFVLSLTRCKPTAYTPRLDHYLQNMLKRPKSLVAIEEGRAASKSIYSLKIWLFSCYFPARSFCRYNSKLSAGILENLWGRGTE